MDVQWHADEAGAAVVVVAVKLMPAWAWAAATRQASESHRSTPPLGCSCWLRMGWLEASQKSGGGRERERERVRVGGSAYCPCTMQFYTGHRGVRSELERVHYECRMKTKTRESSILLEAQRRRGRRLCAATKAACRISCTDESSMIGDGRCSICEGKKKVSFIGGLSLRAFAKRDEEMSSTQQQKKRRPHARRAGHSAARGAWTATRRLARRAHTKIRAGPAALSLPPRSHLLSRLAAVRSHDGAAALGLDAQLQGLVAGGARSPRPRLAPRSGARAGRAARRGVCGRRCRF